ncbi:MAG: hypothetical protein FWH22_08755 [Fibromonadales bacterium]|nr:hypothetical protein [Fibromonadales bacterium]
MSQQRNSAFPAAILAMILATLLIGIQTINAQSLPTVKIEQEHNELDIKTIKKDEPLLLFTIANPDQTPFTLKIRFENNCFLKRINRHSNASFPLNSVKMRFTSSREEIDIWERNRGSDNCEDYFYADFPEKDINESYEIELLGSWGDGGYKFAPGIYGEKVILTILPLQSR